MPDGCLSRISNTLRHLGNWCYITFIIVHYSSSFNFRLEFIYWLNLDVSHNEITFVNADQVGTSCMT